MRQTAFLALLIGVPAALAADEQFHLVAQVGHSSGISSIAFSPDGRFLLTGSTDRSAKLWDARSGELLRTLSDGGHVRAVAFSPDGLFAATASDETVKLWRLADGREILNLDHSADIATNEVYAVTFSHDGKKLLTGSLLFAAVWDLSTGRRQFEAVQIKDSRKAVLLDGSCSDAAELIRRNLGVQVPPPSKPDDCFEIQRTYSNGATVAYRWVSFSSDDRSILLGTEKGLSGVALRSGAATAHWNDASEVSSVSFSADGTFVASCGKDAIVRVRSLPTGTLRLKLQLGEEASYLALTHDYIAIGNLAGGVAVYRLKDGMELREFPPFERIEDRPLLTATRALSFSPDGTQLAGGGNDMVVRVWSVGDGSVLRTFRNAADFANNVAVSADGRHRIAIGTSSGVRLWEPFRSGAASFLTHEPAETIAFSADGRQIAFSDDSGKVGVIDTESGTTRIIWRDPWAETASSLRFSPDGNYLLVSGRLEHELIDLATGAHVIAGSTAFLKPQAPVRFKSEGNSYPIGFGLGGVLFMNEYDANGDPEPVLTNNVITEWDVKTAERIHTYAGHTDQITAVAISPGGQYLLSASRDHTARLWDVATGTPLKTMTHSSEVFDVAFSPDGRFSLTHGRDKISIRSLPMLEEVRVLPSDSLGNLNLNWKTDDVLWSGDGNWDPDNLKKLLEYDEITKPARFLREGKVLLQKYDHTVGLFDAHGQELATLITFGDDWAVVTPSGRFDTSNLDEIKMLHWVIDRPDALPEAVSIELYMRQYYEPRLLRRVVSGESFAGRDIRTLNRAQPQVTIDPNEADPQQSDFACIQVTVHAAIQGGDHSDAYDLRLCRDGQLAAQHPAQGSRTSGHMQVRRQVAQQGNCIRR